MLVQAVTSRDGGKGDSLLLHDVEIKGSPRADFLF